MENIRDRRLRLWKARQTVEGHDVSAVKTLEEAEHFFDKKELPAQADEIATPPVAARNDGENLEVQDVPDEVPEIPDEDEEIEDEQCDIDSVDEPV